MGKVKKLIALGLVAVASMSFVGCKMIAKTPEAIKNEVLAKVGDEKITRGDLDRAMAGVYSQLEQQYGKDYKNNPQIKSQLLEEEKGALNTLAERDVMLAESKKNNWTPSEEDLNKKVDERIAEMKKAYGGDEKFKEAYEAEGFKDEAAVKEQFKDDLIVENVIKEHIIKDIKVSDDEVKKYYEDNKSQFASKKPGAEAYNIVIPDGKDAEATAKKVREEIVSGKVTFAEMAKKYNTDATKDKGGSLGFVDYDSTQLIPEFMDAFKKLKNGEISQPVKSQFGYHLIKAEKINTKTEYTPFKDVKENIKETLLKQKQNKAYEEKLKTWKEEIGVKLYEDRLQ
ncbi:peptidylprolyl isomerase [Clostridium baratii]|uniref:peptidylprolyl isomerase n=1 Tax=Clostridium baratii TaxID=1561 RepID=A0A174ULZ5_9CLOT|nr:peptidylprolyl isomerase [Clostridium baratii]CUQ23494.1 peptidyl-prolyl isomerase [Clostridium baratii]